MACAMLMAGVVVLAMGSREARASGMDGCPEIIIERFGDMAETACYVAWRESRWNPWARGALGEKGYFQIHPIHGSRSTYDPEANVQFAYELSEGGTYWCQGWRWVCR